MAPSQTPPDPSTFIAYSHAAAGHDGVRSDPTGAIVIKPCTTAEVTFYESAVAHPAFQKYMPTFMGTLTLNENQGLSTTTIAVPKILDGLQKVDAAGWVPSQGKKLETRLSIVLENVTAGFKRPNVIDLKLGARLWDDNAPTMKKRKLDEISDATTSRSLGFRIAGMKVHRPEKLEGRCPEHAVVEDDGYLSYGKSYGRGFNAENVHEAFVEFFGGKKTLRKPGRTRHVAQRLAREVRNFVSVLEKEESRMYSASILLVFEGDEEAMETALEEEKPTGATGVAGPGKEIEEDEDSAEDDDDHKSKVYDMRLIDFAHAQWTPGQGPDENALQGIRSVLTILEQLAADDDVYKPKEHTVSENPTDIPL